MNASKSTSNPMFINLTIYITLLYRVADRQESISPSVLQTDRPTKTVGISFVPRNGSIQVNYIYSFVYNVYAYVE